MSQDDPERQGKRTMADKRLQVGPAWRSPVGTPERRRFSLALAETNIESTTTTRIRNESENLETKVAQVSRQYQRLKQVMDALNRTYSQVATERDNLMEINATLRDEIQMVQGALTQLRLAIIPGKERDPTNKRSSHDAVKEKDSSLAEDEDSIGTSDTWLTQADGQLISTDNQAQQLLNRITTWIDASHALPEVQTNPVRRASIPRLPLIHDENSPIPTLLSTQDQHDPEPHTQSVPTTSHPFTKASEAEEPLEMHTRKTDGGVTTETKEWGPVGVMAQEMVNITVEAIRLSALRNQDVEAMKAAIVLMMGQRDNEHKDHAELQIRHKLELEQIEDEKMILQEQLSEAQVVALDKARMYEVDLTALRVDLEKKEEEVSEALRELGKVVGERDEVFVDNIRLKEENDLLRCERSACGPTHKREHLQANDHAKSPDNLVHHPNFQSTPQGEPQPQEPLGDQQGNVCNNKRLGETESPADGKEGITLPLSTPSDRISSLEKAPEQSETKRNQVTSMLEELQTIQQELLTKAQTLHQANQELKREKEDLVNRLLTCRCHPSDSKKESERQNAVKCEGRREDGLGDVKGSFKKPTSELDDLKSQITSLTRALHESQSGKTEALCQCQSAVEQAQALEKARDMLAADLMVSEEDRRQMRDELQQMTATIAEMNDALVRAKEEASVAAKKTEQSMEQKVEKVMAKLITTQEERDDALSRLVAAEGRIKAMRIACDDAEKKLEVAVQSAESAAQTIEIMKEEKAKLHEDMVNTKASSDLQRKAEEEERGQREREMIAQAIREISTKNEQLESALRDGLKSRTTLKEQVRSKDREIATITERLADLEREKDQWAVEKVRINDALCELQQGSADTDRAATTVADDRRKAENLVKEKDGEIERLRMDLHLAQTQAEAVRTSMTGEHDAMKHEITQLNQQLNKAIEEVAAVKAARDVAVVALETAQAISQEGMRDMARLRLMFQEDADRRVREVECYYANELATAGESREHASQRLREVLKQGEEQHAVWSDQEKKIRQAMAALLEEQARIRANETQARTLVEQLLQNTSTHCHTKPNETISKAVSVTENVADIKEHRALVAEIRLEKESAQAFLHEEQRRRESAEARVEELRDLLRTMETKWDRVTKDFGELAERARQHKTDDNTLATGKKEAELALRLHEAEQRERTLRLQLEQITLSSVKQLETLAGEAAITIAEMKQMYTQERVSLEMELARAHQDVHKQTTKEPCSCQKLEGELIESQMKLHDLRSELSVENERRMALEKKLLMLKEQADRAIMEALQAYARVSEQLLAERSRRSHQLPSSLPTSSSSLTKAGNSSNKTSLDVLSTPPYRDTITRRSSAPSLGTSVLPSSTPLTNLEQPQLTNATSQPDTEVRIQDNNDPNRVPRIGTPEHSLTSVRDQLTAEVTKVVENAIERASLAEAKYHDANQLTVELIKANDVLREALDRAELTFTTEQTRNDMLQNALDISEKTIETLNLKIDELTKVIKQHTDDTSETVLANSAAEAAASTTVRHQLDEEMRRIKKGKEEVEDLLMQITEVAKAKETEVVDMRNQVSDLTTLATSLTSQLEVERAHVVELELRMSSAAKDANECARNKEPSEREREDVVEAKRVADENLSTLVATSTMEISGLRIRVAELSQSLNDAQLAISRVPELELELDCAQQAKDQLVSRMDTIATALQTTGTELEELKATLAGKERLLSDLAEKQNIAYEANQQKASEVSSLKERLEVMEQDALKASEEHDAVQHALDIDRAKLSNLQSDLTSYEAKVSTLMAEIAGLRDQVESVKEEKRLVLGRLHELESSYQTQSTQRETYLQNQLIETEKALRSAQTMLNEAIVDRDLAAIKATEAMKMAEECQRIVATEKEKAGSDSGRNRELLRQAETRVATLEQCNASLVDEREVAIKERVIAEADKLGAVRRCEEMEIALHNIGLKAQHSEQNIATLREKYDSAEQMVKQTTATVTQLEQEIAVLTEHLEASDSWTKDELKAIEANAIEDRRRSAQAKAVAEVVNRLLNDGLMGANRVLHNRLVVAEGARDMLNRSRLGLKGHYAFDPHLDKKGHVIASEIKLLPTLGGNNNMSSGEDKDATTQSGSPLLPTDHKTMQQGCPTKPPVISPAARERAIEVFVPHYLSDTLLTVARSMGRVTKLTDQAKDNLVESLTVMDEQLEGAKAALNKQADVSNQLETKHHAEVAERDNLLEEARKRNDELNLAINLAVEHIKTLEGELSRSQNCGTVMAAERDAVSLVFSQHSSSLRNTKQLLVNALALVHGMIPESAFASESGKAMSSEEAISTTLDLDLTSSCSTSTNVEMGLLDTSLGRTEEGEDIADLSAPPTSEPSSGSPNAGKECEKLATALYDAIKRLDSIDQERSTFVSEMKGQVERVSHDLKSTQHELSMAKEALDQSEHVRTNMADALNSMSLRLKKPVEEDSNTPMKVTNEDTNDIDTRQARCESLEAKIATLLQQCSDTTDLLSEKDTVIAGLREIVEKLSASEQDYAEKEQVLTMSLDTASQELSATQEEVERLKRALEDARTEIMQLKQTTIRMEEGMKRAKMDADDAKEHLSLALNDSVCASEALDCESAVVEDSCKALVQETDARDAMQVLIDELKERVREAEVAAIQAASFRNQVDQLQEALKEAQEASEGQLDEISRLEEIVSHHKARIATLEIDIERTKAQVHETPREPRVSFAADSLEMEVDRQRRLAEVARRDADEMAQRLGDAMKALSEKDDALIGELQRLSEEKAYLTERMKRAEAGVEALHTELSALREMVDRETSELVDRRIEVSQAEERIKEKTVALENATAEVHHLKEALEKALQRKQDGTSIFDKNEFKVENPMRGKQLDGVGTGDDDDAPIPPTIDEHGDDDEDQGRVTYVAPEDTIDPNATVESVILHMPDVEDTASEHGTHSFSLRSFDTSLADASPSHLNPGHTQGNESHPYLRSSLPNHRGDRGDRDAMRVVVRVTHTGPTLSSSSLPASTNSSHAPVSNTSDVSNGHHEHDTSTLAQDTTSFVGGIDSSASFFSLNPSNLSTTSTQGSVQSTPQRHQGGSRIGTSAEPPTTSIATNETTAGLTTPRRTGNRKRRRSGANQNSRTPPNR